MFKTIIKSAGMMAFFVIPISVNALVSGPESSIVAGEQVLSLGYTLESGLAKPIENPDSWLSSRIESKRLSYLRGLGDLGGIGSEHTIGLSIQLENSDKEQKNSVTFYDSDSPTSANLNYSFKIVAETSHSVGVYTSLNLAFDGNKEKFAQARNDQLQLGVRSNSIIRSNGIFESWLHYGSGFSGKQNSYLASSFSAGYRFGRPGHIEPSIRLGPYFEYDLDSRKDTKYESNFGTGGRTDSIRQVKLAEAIYFDLSINRKYLVSVTSLKKRSGDDLRSTEAYAIQLSAKF